MRKPASAPQAPVASRRPPPRGSRVDLRPVVAWLMEGARTAATPQAALGELCGRLVEAGLPLDRANVFVQTLHPNVMGRRLTWQDGAVSTYDAPVEILTQDLFVKSPVYAVTASRLPLRRRLCDSSCPLDFPILAELKAEGITDYLAMPMPFSNGELHVFSCATRRPRGFTRAHLEGIESIAGPLSRVAEIWALRRLAVTLLETYVGPHTGTRVLAGKIRLGDTEAIEAVLWLSDLRGFTEMAGRLSAGQLVGELNRFFACQVPAIERHGGEVLKFIGDSVLAIFPVSAARPVRQTCAAALVATREVCARLAEAAPDLSYGIAIHLGEVQHGNIGAGGRLDFTCIGPGVNLVARLEKVAGELDEPVVASRAFADQVPGSFRPLGTFALKGFGGRQEVLGLTAAARRA